MVVAAAVDLVADTMVTTVTVMEMVMEMVTVVHLLMYQANKAKQQTVKQQVEHSPISLSCNNAQSSTNDNTGGIITNA